MPNTKNFKIKEFNCKDGTPVPLKYYSNLRKLMSNLEIIRIHCGNLPIIINSGYRTAEHNKEIGGVSNSYHLKAMAADIKVVGLKSIDVSLIIKRLISLGLITAGGVGTYQTFVHYDIRGHLAQF